MTAILPDSDAATGARRRERRFSVGLVVTGGIAAVLTVSLVLLDADRLTIGAVTVLITLALMLLRIPIAIAMAAPSMLAILLLSNPAALGATLEDVAYSSTASWSLSVIPMFVLMGIAMGRSGLTSGAYQVAERWLGRAPGGLAVATNFTGAGLAATSGSSIGIAYAIGRVAVPEMVRVGYKPPLALGSIAAAGTLGQVIPPSTLLIIYSGIAGTAVGPQLLAGVIPGIALAALFALVIVGWAMLDRQAAPRSTAEYTWVDRGRSLVKLLPIVVVTVLVLGGMYSGVFTATEAGAVAAGFTLVFGATAISWKGKKAGARSRGHSVRSFLSDSLMDTVSAVAAIFLLLIGVSLLNRVMALSGLARWVSDAVVDLGLSKATFLLLLIPVYLVLGFFLDTLAMMILTVPVLLGPLAAMDVDLIWFGVFLIVLAEIDLIAPPLGVLNFVVLAIAQSSTKDLGTRLTIGDVFKGVVPFIAACVVFLVALVAIPEIATWLPGMSDAK